MNIKKTIVASLLAWHAACGGYGKRCLHWRLDGAV